ncbi:MAG: hypothetical protein E6G85_05890 [Alphaproteobacteria bacterium]|nr:MAG: hypothetical protein E6G85_05890 [Alphaproteobacteria bacterium]
MSFALSHASSLSRSKDPSSARSRPGADPTEGGLIGRTARLFGALRFGLTAFACFVALPSVALSHAKDATATASSNARTCSSITYAAPSGPRNNITYVLDKPYVCGQFANGDWFVVPDQAGGAVVVTAITPDYSNLMNGWDTNPDIRGHYYQSWDHRLGYFREPPTLPYAAPAGTSIIKVVSMADCAATTCEQFGAVLTVLEEMPASPQTTFRPPANGTIKPLFSTDLLHPAALPSYPSTCCPSRINAAMALARSKGFRNNYSPDTVSGYYMIPADNVGYQRAWGGDMWLSDLEVLGYLMLDDAPIAKLPVLVAYVQQGIDIWGAHRNGGASWNRGGGGNGAGALTTYVFAAAMLDDPGMLADLKAADMNDFLEGLSFYLGRNGVALYGANRDTIDAYWGGVSTGDASTRDMRDPHGYIDGGPIPGGGYEANLANQVSYLSLLLRALPAFRNAWPTTNSNLSAIVGFGKRYHDHKTLTLPDPCAPAVGTYKRDYGPSGSVSEGFADCIPGNGRFPSLDRSNIANRVSSFLTLLYQYVDRRLP